MQDIITIKLEGDEKSVNKMVAALKRLQKQDQDNSNSFDKNGKLLVLTLEKAKEKIKELGAAIVAAFAVEKIIEFSEECSEAFRHAQKEALILKNALESANYTIKDSGAALEKIDKIAERLEKKSGNLFNDDDLKGFAAGLATAGASLADIEEIMTRIVALSSKKGGENFETLQSSILSYIVSGRGANQLNRETGLFLSKAKSANERIFQFLQQSSKINTGALLRMGATDQAFAERRAKNLAEKSKENIGRIYTNSLDELKEYLGKQALAFTSDEKVNKALDALVNGPKENLRIGPGGEVKSGVDPYEKYRASFTKYLKDLQTFMGTEQVIVEKNDVETSNKMRVHLAKMLSDRMELIKKNITTINTQTPKGMLQAIEKAYLAPYEQYLEELKNRVDNTNAIVQEKNSKQLRDLSKMTTDALNKRLEMIQEEDLEEIRAEDEKYKILPAMQHRYNEGWAEEEARRIQKELTAREKELQKLQQLAEKRLQIDKTLADLEKQIQDTTEANRIETLTNAMEKELAIQKRYFDQQKYLVEQQRDRLMEIMKDKNATKAEKEKANTLLGNIVRPEGEIDQIFAENKQKTDEIKRKYEAQGTRDQLEKYNKEREIQNTLNAQKIEDEKERLTQLYNAGKIKKDEFDTKIKQLDQKRKVDEDKSDLQYINMQKATIENEYKDGLITKEEYDKLMLDEEAQYQQALLKLKEDSATNVKEIDKKTAEEAKRLLEQFQEFSQNVFQNVEQNTENNISMIDTQMDYQNKMIDTQKALAQKGLDTDLAFEQKRASDLEAQKLKEQKRLRKEKEMEVFVNAVSKYAEENPNSAIGKAALLVAGMKVAEAAYAEKGGIIGQGTDKSSVMFMSDRMHASGGDVLLHAQKGEAVLSLKDMAKLKEGILPEWMSSMMLKPLNELPLPLLGSQLSTSGIEKRLDKLETTIRNKKEISIDFDDVGAMIVRETENGIRKITKHMLRKT